MADGAPQLHEQVSALKGQVEKLASEVADLQRNVCIYGASASVAAAPAPEVAVGASASVLAQSPAPVAAAPPPEVAVGAARRSARPLLVPLVPAFAPRPPVQFFRCTVCGTIPCRPYNGEGVFGDLPMECPRFRAAFDRWWRDESL